MLVNSFMSHQSDSPLRHIAKKKYIKASREDDVEPV